MIKTAVYMAAGVGSRLKGYFDEKPKGFLNIGGMPIIERSIGILLKNGIERVLIGTGHKSEYYESLERKYRQVSCVKNCKYEDTGSFFTFSTMFDRITEGFLLMESDLLFEQRSIPVLERDPRPDVILASGRTGSGDEVYIEVDRDDCLLRMSKKRKDLENIYGELVGISKLSFSTLDALREWKNKNPEIAKKCDYEFALSSISRRVSIAVNRIDDLVWAEIDDESHLKRAMTNVYPKIAEKENE
jgi:2-aminoethylphosphonate-pyruvate transaminase